MAVDHLAELIRQPVRVVVVIILIILVIIIINNSIRGQS
jgi:cell division protein FtsX